MYHRLHFQKVMKRIEGPRLFMQVLAGPRQVGKSTLAHQVRKSVAFPSHYASTDGFSSHNSDWIEEQWEIARQINIKANNTLGTLLILDEVQKIPHWSETVKKLWDEDTLNNVNLKVMLLGSATLLIQTGLGESLSGRFEVIPISHWSFEECRDAFDWTLEQFVYFGGYPGAAQLIKDEERWAHYIIDSIIETSVSRDIMLMTRIYKPALLRTVFELGCHCTGRIISYQKMLGQLQDAGNASTLAHYLELLSEVGLVGGLQKFSKDKLRQKASSPKLQVFNTAFITAQSHLSFKKAQKDTAVWKSLLECSIGAHIINAALGTKIEVFYWKEGNKEVDFVVRKGELVITITVRKPNKGINLRGIEEFSRLYSPQQNLFIGGPGIAIDKFLLTPLDYWIDSVAEDLKESA
ncbi:MAG: ATP-binding protein [Proteobacteria bacterium]|nr:ATP-binding protein [Pseudomonadota bacterium]